MNYDESAPSIVGRRDDGGIEERAKTRLRARASVDFTSGACGESILEAFESVDDEDRGGYVLRFTVEQPDCAFIPHAKVLPNGVELHLGGDAEAETMLRALRAVLEQLPLRRTCAVSAIDLKVVDPYAPIPD